jgi:hypothetical protein
MEILVDLSRLHVEDVNENLDVSKDGLPLRPDEALQKRLLSVSSDLG